jgi:hypothetical protein
MEINIAFFRASFIEAKGLTKLVVSTPSEFDDSTPVLVIEMGNGQAGEVLGVSAVKDGESNGYDAFGVYDCCVLSE